MSELTTHDVHVRRAGEDYARAFLNLLPTGQAWPRHALDSILVRTVYGLCDYWGTVDARAADLLEQESDPRKTLELLPDWERNWGLPDPCYPAPQSIGERQRALVVWMTTIGGQSRDYFINLAASFGYTISITEYRPFMVGVDKCGDNRVIGDGSGTQRDYTGHIAQTERGYPLKLEVGEYSEWINRIGPPENRFYWTVHVSDPRLIWFRVGGGGGQCGIDPHLRIIYAQDLACLLDRWKPAHTSIIFDYSQAGFTIDGIPHSDETLFSDDAGYSQRVEQAIDSDTSQPFTLVASNSITIGNVATLATPPIINAAASQTLSIGQSAQIVVAPPASVTAIQSLTLSQNASGSLVPVTYRQQALSATRAGIGTAIVTTVTPSSGTQIIPGIGAVT